MQENVKQVVVKMTARRCFRTEPIWQYDGGHVLTFEGFDLPMSFEVHFSRSPMGNAIPQIGTNGACTVPEMFTQNAGVIYAWLYIADVDSRLTKYSIEIPVAKRAKPTNQEPTPVEQSAIDQAIAALNAGVEAAEDAQEAAEAAQASAESYAESAGQSTITAINAATSAAASAGNAASSATAAASSATDAHTSREAADQSATNAGVSERAAASSASAAAGSASAAAQSATSASGSASSASEAAGAAVAAKGAAETAQAAAEAAMETVAESAADAAESATTATGAATNAAQSASNASASATAAAGSATAAAGSAQTAQDVLDSIPADYSTLSEDVDSLKSAFDDMIVVTVGENLTNPAELYGATIDNTTGEISTPNLYYVCSGHIPCTPGETLYILWYVGTNDIRVRKTANDKIAFYKEDGTFISIGYNEDSYTVPELAAYCIQQGYKAVTEANTVAVFRIPASSLNGRWVYYQETKTLQYSYTPTEVLERLGDIDDCMKTADYLDYSMVNRLDPTECIIGKSVDILSGDLFDSSSRFTTGFMEIHKNETLYLFATDGILSAYVNRFAAYDKDKNVLPTFGAVSSNPYIVQSGEMAYIRVTFTYYASDIYRTPNGNVCLANQHPLFIPGFGASPVIKSQYMRPVINVLSTDTEAQIITKLVSAYNISNCDVIFERSNYAFGEELAKVSTDYGMDSNEIPIGNGCRYFFNGSHLTATIDLLQHPASGNDEFYCNFFGCQRRPSSYELHDGVLIATDTRYIVHDESSAMNGSYKHLYQNMEMHYHTNDRQEAIRKCIGGGTGASGVVEIVGCKFTTDGTDACVSFHGNSSDVVGAEFDLNIRDSWFSNSVRAGSLSTNQTARLFYTGNSAVGEPTVYDRWTVTKFLNEVRN